MFRVVKALFNVSDEEKVWFSLPVQFFTIALGGSGWKVRRRSRASVNSRWFCFCPAGGVPLALASVGSAEAIGYRSAVAACSS